MSEPADALTARTLVTVTHDGRRDEVVVEEPLEIRVDGAPLAMTMRTPAHDEELALGFLYGEGLIDGPRAAGPTEDFAANIVEVCGPLLRDPAARRFYATSSCGVCGKGALEELSVIAPVVGPGPRSPAAAGGPARPPAPADLRAHRGLHATGLFSAEGELLLVREDVGRHNAMDKVVGRALLDGLLPLGDGILCVSGRLCFELVQKAAMAGAPILVGVGAPSSLAIELAADHGITLARLRPPGQRQRLHRGAAPPGPLRAPGGRPRWPHLRTRPRPTPSTSTIPTPPETRISSRGRSPT